MKWLHLVVKGTGIVVWRLRYHGVAVTFTWAWTRLYLWTVRRPVWRYCAITPDLCVGGQINAAGWRWLAARGITAVVNVRSEFDDAAHGIAPDAYIWLPTPDDHAPTMQQLRSGVGFISQVIQQGGKVYVHCASGVGRAPAMAAAYLISTGMRVEEAIALIRQVRPFVKLTEPQLEILEQFTAEVEHLDEADMPANQPLGLGQGTATLDSGDSGLTADSLTPPGQ